MRSEALPLRRLQIGANHISNDNIPLAGRFLVPGTAEADIIFTKTPISFMMGVDPVTGIVMDNHHPLLGTSLADKIFIIPRGRGSCAASAVILELLYQGTGPSALIFREMEPILLVGVLLAGALYSKSIPVLQIDDDDVWHKLSVAPSCKITPKGLAIGDEYVYLDRPYAKSVPVTSEDEHILRGEGCSLAKQMAMELIVEFASIQGAKNLISVSQVHVDACCLVGQTSLLVPQRLLALGGRFCVPSTCNSIDVDMQRWQSFGSDPAVSKVAIDIGNVYLEMGASLSFTCAPYLLDSRPVAGDQVAWGESNAVVFANSVLGARTQKYPDYLDVLIALTGRAPALGCHLDSGRRPSISFHVDVKDLAGFDEAIFPLVGYYVGSLVGGDIPIIYGLEGTDPETPDLKAFSAAFATTSSAAMFHIHGVTPEADTVEVPQGIIEIAIGRKQLSTTWEQLQTVKDSRIDVISIGNPHVALEEFPRFISLIKNRSKSSDVTIIFTLGRFIYDKAREAGYLDIAAKFGVQFVTDTCWCMLKEPIIPPQARNIMTISAKYAHYGPGVSGRGVAFGSMAEVVEAACTGRRPSAPGWLFRPY